MRTSRFTMYTAAVTLFLCLAAASQDKPNALPWPAPEMWDGRMKANFAYLGVAKTYYLQTALRPEEATPPRWLARYQAEAPDKADILIFIRTQSKTLSRFTLDPRSGLPRETDVREGTVYQMLVTDHNGNLVTRSDNESLQKIWDNFEAVSTAQRKTRQSNH